MASKYYHVSDGEWITVRMKGFRDQCCDCGLVHIVDYRVTPKGLQIRSTRDPRATNGARRATQHSKKKRRG